MRTCECCDVGCPIDHAGECNAPATETLVRFDLAGEPECDFCGDCANDALDSGVFSTKDEDETIFCEACESESLDDCVCAEVE